MDHFYEIQGVLWKGTIGAYDGGKNWAPSLEEAEALVEACYLTGDFQSVKIVDPDLESVFTEYTLHCGVWFKDGEALRALAEA